MNSKECPNNFLGGCEVAGIAIANEVQPDRNSLPRAEVEDGGDGAGG